MRRVGFSGRIQIPRPVAHTKSAKTHTARNKKQGKTGIFCKKRAFRPKITQPALEYTYGFLSTCALLSPKFPTKITGNFSDHNRDFPPNIREFNKLTAKPIFILFFKVYVIFFEKRSPNMPGYIFYIKPCIL